MQFRVSSITILSLLVASFLFVGTRIAGATATATINSISATGVGRLLGTLTFTDSPDGLVRSSARFLTPRTTVATPGMESA
jgi:hypothetical protein